MQLYRNRMTQTNTERGGGGGAKAKAKVRRLFTSILGILVTKQSSVTQARVVYKGRCRKKMKLDI